MSRNRKIKIAILRILKSAHDAGYMVREQDLQNELTLSVRPAPLSSETAQLVRELDQAKHLIGVRDDEILRLSISPAGEAWLIQETTL